MSHAPNLGLLYTKCILGTNDYLLLEGGEGTEDLVGGDRMVRGGGLSPTECEGNNIEN